jgi:hypothetical protein
MSYPAWTLGPKSFKPVWVGRTRLERMLNEMGNAFGRTDALIN